MKTDLDTEAKIAKVPPPSKGGKESADESVLGAVAGAAFCSRLPQRIPGH
jgi:hypothetical protein